ncbi:MAG: hypothetical protein QM756_46755 [Polyangiaceae bacterium]
MSGHLTQNPSSWSRGAQRAATLSFLLVAFTAPPLSAQSDAKAEAAIHFTRGVEFANQGAYADALRHFSRAYELSPHYSVLYNIGQAYIGLSQPLPAVEALKRYLAEGGSQVGLERRRVVEAQILEQFSHTGLVSVEVNTPGAAISVDGQAVGRSPLSGPLRLAAGEHTLAARLDSGEHSEQRIVVTGDGRHALRLEIAPSAVAAQSPVTSAWLQLSCRAASASVTLDGTSLGNTPLPAPVAVTAGRHLVRFADDARRNEPERAIELSAGQTAHVDCSWPTAPPPAQPSRSQRSTWGYVLGSAGLSLGVAALGHYFWNKGRYEDWQLQYAAYQDSPSADKRERANELGKSVERASIATVALSVGAGLALGGGVLLVVTDQPVKESRATWLGWRQRF